MNLPMLASFGLQTISAIAFFGGFFFYIQFVISLIRAQYYLSLLAAIAAPILIAYLSVFGNLK